MEVLLGGLCDGLTVNGAAGYDVYYAGRYGDGKINVYTRRCDGRFRFSHILRVRPNMIVETTSCATTIKTTGTPTT